VAYTYNYQGNMGLKGLSVGEYDFIWFDTTSGKETGQNGVQVEWGDSTWEKPAELSNEVVLYIKRGKD